LLYFCSNVVSISIFFTSNPALLGFSHLLFACSRICLSWDSVFILSLLNIAIVSDVSFHFHDILSSGYLTQSYHCVFAFIISVLSHGWNGTSLIFASFEMYALITFNLSHSVFTLHSIFARFHLIFQKSIACVLSGVK